MSEGRGVRWWIRWVTDKRTQRQVEQDNVASARKAEGDWKASASRTQATWRTGMQRAARDASSAWGRAAATARTAWSGALAALRSPLGALAAGLGGLFAVGRVTAFVAELRRLGPAQEEILSRYQITFGEATASLDEWILKFQDLSGATVDEGQAMLSTLGAIAQGMGATQATSAELAVSMSELAGDLTSFYDVPIAESLQAIQSAAVGMYRPLQRFGVVLTAADVEARALAMTGKATAQELLQWELAAARVSVITERMGPALGNLNATAESTANQTRQVAGAFRQMEGDLATGLLPIVREFTATLADQESWVFRLRRGITAWAESMTRNALEIQKWTRVTILAFRAVGGTLTGLVRVAFNVGQAIGNLMVLVVAATATSVGEVFNGTVALLNGMIEQANRLPGIDIDFRIQGLDLSDWERRLADSGKYLRNNALDAYDAVDGLVQRWVDVAVAASVAADNQIQATNLSSGGGQLRPEGEEPETTPGTGEGNESSSSGGTPRRGVSLDTGVRSIFGGGGPGGRSLELGLFDRGGPSPQELVAQQLFQGQDLLAERLQGAVVGQAISEMFAGAAAERAEENARMMAERVAGYFSAAASAMQDTWRNVWAGITEEGNAATAVLEGLFRSLASGALAALEEHASGKVGENAAAAAEEAAKALGAAARGNLAAAAGHSSAALKHVGAMSLWAAVAGGAGAAGGAVAGGGARVGSASGSRDPASQRLDGSQRSGPEINVYVNPFNPQDPVQYRGLAEGLQNWSETTGGRFNFRFQRS